MAAFDAHGLTWRDKGEDGNWQTIVRVGALELFLVAVPVKNAERQQLQLGAIANGMLEDVPEATLALDGEECFLVVTSIEQAKV